eukprot:m.17202 g.17202  ORF g.17202 m.17202 type:complete len:716 (+) comp4742_c0_seq1:102-2249(+)
MGDDLDQSQLLSVERLARILGEETAVETVLRNESRAYNVVYKGSAPVAAASMGKALWSMFGMQIITNTVKKLKKRKEKDRKVILTISKSGLKIEESNCASILAFETLDTITYVGIDENDPKRISYVSNYPRLGLFYCHIIQMKSKAAAVEMKEKLESILHRSKKLLLGNPSTFSTVDEDDEEDDLVFGFEVENDSQKTIRSKIDTLYGQTVGIMEVDFVMSQPLTQVELGQAVKDEDTSVHLQHVIDTVVGNLPAANSKKITRKKSSVRRASKNEAHHVVFIATMEGVRVVDSSSREEFMFHFIKDIKLYGKVSFGKECSAFAFVTCDQLLESISCHIFFTHSPQHAEELTLSVGKAVSACEELDELQNYQPFMPLARTKGALAGVLGKMEVQRNHLEKLKSIGAGQFGVVFKVNQTIGGTDETVTRAVKALRQNSSQREMACFIREAEVMCELKHTSIVTLEGVCLQEHPWLIIQELVLYGDLDYVLRAGMERGVTITLKEVLHFALQICDALAYIHDLGVLHNDIAARNVLLGARNEIKLADFGMARKLKEGKSSLHLKDLPMVSTRWLSTEVLERRIVSDKSDVWAFGICLWEICMHGDKPYSDIHFLVIEREVIAGKRPYRPDDSVCNDTLWDVMQRCWDKKPEKRPSSKDLRTKLKDIAAKHDKAHAKVQGDEVPLAEDISDLGRLVFAKTKGKKGSTMTSYQHSFATMK